MRWLGASWQRRRAGGAWETQRRRERWLGTPSATGRWRLGLGGWEGGRGKGRGWTALGQVELRRPPQAKKMMGHGGDAGAGWARRERRDIGDMVEEDAKERIWTAPGQVELCRTPQSKKMTRLVQWNCGRGGGLCPVLFLVGRRREGAGVRPVHIAALLAAEGRRSPTPRACVTSCRSSSSITGSDFYFTQL